jgi:predicted enzyme related to lactoylglutathione lyase
MPDRTSHPAGAFSWAELATSDPDAAKSFYAGVLGWTYQDDPLPGGGVYSMAQVRGRTAAAVFAAPPEQGPPHWNAYVTVSSADEAAERAAGLGATVVAPPFDVMDAGRMAVLQDPAEVFLNVWEPRSSIGAQVVNEHGTLTWNEVVTRDADAARSFYADLLGWEFEAIPQAPFPMWSIRLGGRGNGSLRQMGDETPAEIPPHVLTYFAIDDLPAAVEAAQAGGGRLVVGPQEVPAGAFVILADPQGAMFGLSSGEFDD